MGIRWTPRSLLTVSLGAIAILAVALALLGWMLVAQDRELERTRVTERLTYAVNLVIADLQQRLDATSKQLATFANADAAVVEGATAALSIRDDAVVVVMTPQELRASAPLVFYPDQPDPVDTLAATFAEAEALELAGRDLPSALAAYQRLAKSPDPRVRAGAWLRAARVARRIERLPVALAAYDELARLGPVLATGRPASLVAILERRAILEPPTNGLEHGLRSGRWRLSRGEYYAYLNLVRLPRPGGGTTPTQPSLNAEALADGVAVAFHTARSPTAADLPGGSQTLDPDASPTNAASSLIVWRRAGDRTAALVATPEYAERMFFPGLAAIADRERARVTVTGAGNHVWLGEGQDAAHTVRRSPAEAELPFAIGISSADPAGDAALFSGRRRLLAGVFGLVGLLLGAGGYIAARGISKELEVARLQSDFVAAVSHEFRTPVASVRQLSEVLDDGRVPDEARRARYYGLLRRESERLQRLVEGLLDFGRMESNAAEYRFERLDPETLVRQVADEFTGAAGADVERVVVSIAAELPGIRADREALGRALWNLLDNAAKYSPADAAITIEASVVNRAVSIRVRDQGPGIAPAEQRRIFTKFVRGATARSSGAKGTGLGLAMVAHIMRAHHGEVRVESQVGAGATFSLVLPCEGTVR